MMIHIEIDARGLNCPLPLLRLKKGLAALESGALLHIVATDPASVLDFGVFLEQAGHALVERREASGEFIFLIRKG